MTTLDQPKQLHVLFFPYMAHGHMIPMIDIVTTPLNHPLVSRQISNSPFEIGVQLLPFPTSVPGVPEGCEHLDFIRSRMLYPEGYDRFNFATTLLQPPLEKLLQEIRPDLVISDQYFPWTNDSASKFGIPRVTFHGNGFFALCAMISVEQNIYGKIPNVNSDPTPFVIPDLPDEIMITGKQVPIYNPVNQRETAKLFVARRKAELTGFGVIINSFYELESAYADHYRNFLGRRAWSVGPVSLCNRNVEEKSRRGIEGSIGQQEYCLKWLNTKKPNSVVYLSFGTLSYFSADQLKEIEIGLQSSGKDFIWSVINQDDKEEDWMPEGFEERMEGKGLIIRGWAPQVVILEHEAVGGFVSHCGWNSTLEAIVAGLPMVTWPFEVSNFTMRNW